MNFANLSVLGSRPCGPLSFPKNPPSPFTPFHVWPVDKSWCYFSPLSIWFLSPLLLVFVEASRPSAWFNIIVSSLSFPSLVSLFLVQPLYCAVLGIILENTNKWVHYSWELPIAYNVKTRLTTFTFGPNRWSRPRAQPPASLTVHGPLCPPLPSGLTCAVAPSLGVDAFARCPSDTQPLIFRLSSYLLGRFYRWP